jgi:hypothetical protein
MLTNEEIQVAIDAAEVFPVGHGNDWYADGYP